MLVLADVALDPAAESRAAANRDLASVDDRLPTPGVAVDVHLLLHAQRHADLVGLSGAVGLDDADLCLDGGSAGESGSELVEIVDAQIAVPRVVIREGERASLLYGHRLTPSADQSRPQPGAPSRWTGDARGRPSA